MSLEGHTALVTGSGRNIGRSIALAFAREGTNVVVNGRSSQGEVDAVVREAKELGVDAIGVMADVSDPAQVRHMTDTALATFGTVDIVVNNAAVRPHVPFTEMDYDQWRNVIGVDLDASFLCCQALVPGMIQQSWGRIINIAGMMAFEGRSGYVHISAAKMGLVGMTRSLAVELAPHNILVNCISPGTIGTVNPNADPDMDPARRAELVAERVARVPLGRLADPDEISALCVFLASPGGGYISGQTIHVNGAADRR